MHTCTWGPGEDLLEIVGTPGYTQLLYNHHELDIMLMLFLYLKCLKFLESTLHYLEHSQQ